MEAICALDIVQKRLLNRDYAGAKEMALRAKKLFPLYNNSQILAVFEAVPQIGALLHPDKKKMPGAEAAFKLVREAHNTLSDRAKRIMYHRKRKHPFSTTGPQESTKTITAPNSCSNLNCASKLRPQQQPQPPRSDSYRFTYVRRVRGIIRDNTGGVQKHDNNCPSMSNCNNPNTINGLRSKRISADKSQDPNPCSKPDLSLCVNQRRGDAEGTDG